MNDSPASIPVAFRKIVEFLSAQRIPHVLIGGIAVGLQGEPRATIDVDLLISIPSRQIQQIATEARAAGFSIEPELARTQWLASGFARFWLGEEGSGVPIDLMACNSEYLKQVVWRAQPVSFAGIHVPVATPEDLVLLKSCAWRERDIPDIRSILVRHAGKIDREYLQKWARWLADQNDYFGPVPARVQAFLADDPLPPAVPD